MSLLVTFTQQAKRHHDSAEVTVSVNTARILTVTADENSGGSKIKIDAGDNSSLMDRHIAVTETPDEVERRINQAVSKLGIPAP